MNKFKLKLNLNRKLASILFILGFIALFAGSPYKGNHISMNTKEISLIIQNSGNKISAEELADWIIQGKSDYRLIDLRTEKEFYSYNIPTSENFETANIDKAGLNRNEKIILYSSNGVDASQTWFLMKAMGYNSTYFLENGVNEWNEKILFPTLSENASENEKSGFQKKIEVSKFFGGTPVTDGEVKSEKKTPDINIPKIESPGNIKIQQIPKKKKEGC